MKPTLRVLPDAERELGEAAAWYEAKRPGLGVELVAVVDAAIDRMLERPNASPQWLEGRPYRKHLLRRFPYVIFFTADAGGIEVVAFAHAKRRPGYWLDRVRSRTPP